MGLKIKFSSKSQRAILIGLFFAFLVFGINQTKWEGAYIQSWERLDISFTSTKRQTEAPYMRPIGNIDDDPYPEIVLYDGFEKAIAFNASPSYGPLVNSGEIYNESIKILKEIDYFEYYGKSRIGIYSLTSTIGNPKIEWSLYFEDSDIFALEVIGDVNDDGVNDIIVSKGVLNELPNPIEFGYSSLSQLFLENHFIYEDFFIVDKLEDKILITPKYSENLLSIHSGADGELIESSELAMLEYIGCVLDIIYLNKSIQEFEQTNCILKTSLISAPRLYSPLSTQFMQMGESYNYSLYGLGILPFELTWVKNQTNLVANDLMSFTGSEIHIPSINSLNVSIKYAKEIQIEPSGDNFIVRFVAANASTQTGGMINEWGAIPENQFFMVCNGSDGSKLWSGDLNKQYLTRKTDINNDGFGQINGFYVNDTDLYFVYYNATNGDPICKSRLEYDETRLLNYNTTDYSQIMITDDDVMGNDGVLELICVSLNETYYNEYIAHKNDANPEINENEADPMQVIRINMNQSMDVTWTITPITREYNINLKNAIDFNLQWYLTQTGVDFDNDGIKDYLVYSDDKVTRITEDTEIQSSKIGLISGKGIILHPRNLESAISTYVEAQGEITFDFRNIDEVVYFFVDPMNSLRVSMISINPYELFYIQDINIFTPQESFMNFFLGADILTYILIGGAGLCIFYAFTGIKKREERDNTEFKDKKAMKIEKESSNFNKTLIVSLILALVTIIVIEYFFTRSISMVIGYTDVVVSAEGQLIWFLLLYPMIFLLMAIIPDLYNKSAPFFAEKVFINSQKQFFKIYTKKGMKDYRIIIINMKNRNDVSAFTRISRMLLPLLISLTIGITVYQGLGETGFMYKALSPDLIDHPLTDPNVLGVMTDSMTSADDIWIEIGKFARYCVLPMIVTYLFSSILIPGAWLLDDAGVCYYEQALKFREISDIDSISKWTLNFISGLFGFTAIVSFFDLFSPMLSQIDELIFNISALTDDPAMFGVAVLILALIVFPILVGIILMYSSMQLMEKNYHDNVLNLYKRMEKQGIDTTPHDLTAILDAKMPERKFDLPESSSDQEDRDESESVETVLMNQNNEKIKIKEVNFEDKYDEYLN